MKKVIALFVLFGLCAMFPVNMLSANVESPSTTQYSSSQRSADIIKTWITYDNYVESTLALTIHLDLYLYGCKGMEIRVSAFLYNNDGSSMINHNTGKAYRTKDDHQVCRTYIATPKYDSSHYKDFDIIIPLDILTVPVRDKDFKIEIEISDASTDKIIKRTSKLSALSLKGYGAMFLSYNFKKNATYTNSNPLYLRSNNEGIIYERYYVGRTNANAGYEGWGQLRQINETGVFEDIGEFRKNNLYNGTSLSYYQKEPENVYVEYVENGEIILRKYIRQSEVFKYKADAERIARNANRPVMSDRLQSKVNTSYLSRSNDNTFKGLKNEFAAIDNRKPAAASSYNSSSSSSYSTSSSSSSNSGISSGTTLAIAGLAALAWGLIKGGEAIDQTIENTKKAREEERAAAARAVEREAPKSMKNVELVDGWTLGILAISHAKVQIRNRNNYDVSVRIGLYQGSWSDGEIIYSDGERSDYIPGVSDSYSKSIIVKANSIRTVYLRGESTGRPSNIRITSVR